MVEFFAAHNREKVELCLAHNGIVVHNSRGEMVEFFVAHNREKVELCLAHNGIVVHNSREENNGRVFRCTQWHDSTRQ